MKRTSIKTAILIPSLAVLIAGIIMMAAVAGILSSRTDNNLTTQLVEARVSEYSNKFGELCGEVNAMITAAAPIIANYINPEFAADVSNPRGEVTDIVAKVLMSNEKIVGAWTCWEPDAFDGKDIDFANTSFYDSSGRFVPYIYKNDSGYGIEALVDYEDPVAGEYYRGARDTGKPYITDPYFYYIDGKEILICSIAVPIMQNGKVAGVVGANINLDLFEDLIQSAQILGDGFLFVLSPKGLVSAHPNETLIKNRYDKYWMRSCRSQIESVLSNGGNFSANEYSDLINSDVLFIGSGVMIGKTGRYWLVCGVIPKNTINASSTSLLWTIIVIGIFVILIVGLTIFFIIRSRLKDLPKLTATAEAVAEGDVNSANLDAGTEETKNEITKLSRAFYKMANGIKKQADALYEISHGDYSLTIPIRSDKDIMNQAITKMLDSTNTTLNQINAAAAHVSSGSKQIASGAQALAQGSTEQAAAIEELSVTINDISDKTDHNAIITKEAANLSCIIKDTAEKGNLQMEQMMKAVIEINKASSKIGKVIKVIDDIAFQTNILALNAAVEAARAGQHGKGFAVVAEEVRSLAAKSAEAAKDTGSMIENSIEKANKGLDIATETSRSLIEIVNGINRSAEIITKIAQSSDEQAIAISQINKGIGQVSQVIQQNSATAQESASASEEMSEQSSTLNQLTAQFKLKD